jgi:hypothetical protein
MASDRADEDTLKPQRLRILHEVICSTWILFGQASKVVWQLLILLDTVGTTALEYRMLGFPRSLIVHINLIGSSATKSRRVHVELSADVRYASAGLPQ